MNITAFNNKLQATNFEVKKGATSIVKKQYQFYADASLKYSQDELNGNFDRLYRYDQIGRTTDAQSGANARGLIDISRNIPYRQYFQYNGFSNMTQSVMEHFASGGDLESHNYVNNRKIDLSATYDAEGNELSDENAVYEFDATGELTKTTAKDQDNPTELLPPTNRYLDGEGKELKRIRYYSLPTAATPTYMANYYIYSSVTGKLVSEMKDKGAKEKTFVTANGATVAEQQIDLTGEHLAFYHQDASGASLQMTKENGDLSGYRTSEFDAVGNNVGSANPYLNGNPPNNQPGEFGITFNDPAGTSIRSTNAGGSDPGYDGTQDDPAELDPQGGNVGFSTPYFVLNTNLPQDVPSWDYLYDESPLFVNGQRLNFSIDGFAIPASQALNLLRAGAVIPASLERDQNRPGFRFDDTGSGIFRVHIPGYRQEEASGGGSGDGNDPIQVGSYFDHPARTFTWSVGAALGSAFGSQTKQTITVSDGIGSKGSSGGKNRGKAKKTNIANAINICSERLYGVTLTSFVPTDKGGNGYAFFLPKEANEYTNRSFGVTNSVAFNQADLFLLSGKKGVGKTFYSRSLVDGVTPKYGIYTVPTADHTLSDGTTRNFPFVTNINYTASDITAASGRNGFSAFLTTQIHELGNSLQLITGRDYKPDPNSKDDDAGQAFETCVVNEYNKLPKSR